jgi:glycine/D-amino acid oxidase-like deaminating enzyme
MLRRSRTTVATFRAGTFRPPGATRALWLRQALAAEGGAAASCADPTPVPPRADVCIVGGGFTGLWTALALKEHDPSLHVVVLEADLCGSGASGRNGGFVMTAWSKFSSLRKLCGADDSLRYARATEQAVLEIGRFCAEHDIDADFRRAGWLWTATNATQVDAWRATIDEIAAQGAEPYVPLSGEEVATRSGSPCHLAGVFEAGAGTVQPAALARGMAAVARRAGVVIVERTPMTALHADPQPRVRTPRGELRAERVVLAINAWAAALPQLRRSLVVVASDVIATEPIPARLDQIGWDAGVSISDSRRLVNYYHRSGDGRVVFGKGGGTLSMGGRIQASFHGDSPRAGEVRRQFRHIYPALWDAPIACSWRGPIDYSMSGLPFLCALDGHPEVLVGAGFSGNGVGPSYLAGRALAAMAVGARDETVPEALRRAPGSTLPPEPLRFAGGLLVRAAIAGKERAEDAGRRPGRAVQMVAGLDPTSFIDRAADPAIPTVVPASAQEPEEPARAFDR